MHPAFSVIFFTTLSGAGYGLWFWSALSLWLSPWLLLSSLSMAPLARSLPPTFPPNPSPPQCRLSGE